MEAISIRYCPVGTSPRTNAAAGGRPTAAIIFSCQPRETPTEQATACGLSGKKQALHSGQLKQHSRAWGHGRELEIAIPFHDFFHAVQ